jgi:periplasmic divalent cation tolerance protein
MSEHIIVTTTTDTQDRARDMARILVAEKLAACIEIHAIDSIYPWKGQVCETQEWVLVMKTRADLYKPLEGRILALHTYELPQIIAMPISDGSPGYLDWVRQETQPATK